MSYDAFGGGGASFAGGRLMWLLFWAAAILIGIAVGSMT